MHTLFSFTCPRYNFVVHSNITLAYWLGSCIKSYNSINFGPAATSKPEDTR